MWSESITDHVQLSAPSFSAVTLKMSELEPFEISCVGYHEFPNQEDILDVAP